MKGSPRERRLYLLSIPFAIAPFAVGIIRAVQTGRDFRLLWMAFASFLGAAMITAIVKARNGNPSVLALSAVVFVMSAVFAALTGFLLGARAGPGTWMVAVVLGLCWAASYALYNLSRPRAA
jgi:hypothetical protein